MTTETAGAGVRGDEEGQRYYGSVVIEWPAPRKPGSLFLPAWDVSVFDAVTGVRITTVSDATVVHANPSRAIIAHLVMFADEHGNPVYDGRPRVVDGEVAMGAFPFLVAEMRVRADSQADSSKETAG